MKAPALLIAFLAGAVATGAAFATIGHRYTVSQGNAHALTMRVDNWTGRTWVMSGGEWRQVDVQKPFDASAYLDQKR